MSQVAKTILNQLGAGRFVAMTGARGFVGSSDALSFRLPGAGGFCKSGINWVRVTLTAADDYRVEFARVRGNACYRVSVSDGVYAENLREVFESATGLRTSL